MSEMFKLVEGFDKVEGYDTWIKEQMPGKKGLQAIQEEEESQNDEEPTPAKPAVTQISQPEPEKQRKETTLQFQAVKDFIENQSL